MKKIIAFIAVVLFAASSCVTKGEIRKVIEPDYMAQIIHEDGVPVVYENAQFPLRVYSELSYAAETLSAIEVWNAWMGFEFFKLTLNSLEGDIFVFDGGEHERWNGVTYHLEVPPEVAHLFRYKKVAKIVMFKRAAVDTLSHELGHAVGLAHDPTNARSIMHNWSNTRYMPTLEPQDRAALRQVYGLN